MVPMDPAAAFELVMLLQQFGQASDRYVESTGTRYRTHRTDMNALSVIIGFEREGTCPTPGDLSRILQLSSPATSAMLDRLERMGHIQRLRIDKDRRVVRIKATPKAHADGKAMFAPLATSMMGVISAYTQEEVKLISRFMSDAAAGVDKARQDGENT
ncbi:hypothetical protein GCM10025778_27580 [Paeniglutamicibacter antarcticus]|uniref:HTH marR-type domain-containing protein n=2 Tax=Paeniglutamicibacter antarcticus TaxID=494023 RepID=A0ABP9TPW3_9MICC